MARCSYLDMDGRQCPRAATTTRALHLDGEIYTSIDLAKWVAVPLCELHAAVGGSAVKRRRVVQ